MVKITGIDIVMTNLEAWGKDYKKELYKASRVAIAPMLEKYAKENRPWTDRTGNARRLLGTEVELSTNELVIRLQHGVTYGIFLETMQAGRFSVLKPTLEANLSAIARILNRV